MNQFKHYPRGAVLLVPRSAEVHMYVGVESSKSFEVFFFLVSPLWTRASLLSILVSSCPPLMGLVAMVTPTLCKMHDGRGYNYKFLRTFQLSWLQQPLRINYVTSGGFFFLTKIVTSKQKGANTQLQMCDTLFEVGRRVFLLQQILNKVQLID